MEIYRQLFKPCADAAGFFEPSDALLNYASSAIGAEFTDVNAAGFTLAVWITTNLIPDEATTRRIFGDALLTLTDFLCGVGRAPLPTLY